MPTCPAGHTSAAADFCDVCGMRIGAAEQQPAAPAEPCPQCGTAKSGRFCESCGFDFDTGPPAAARAMPGGDRGVPVPATAETPTNTPVPATPQYPTNTPVPATPQYPTNTPVPATAEPAPSASGPGVWTAVVASDRAYFDDVVAAGGPDAATLEFPAYCPERRFRLAGPEMRIGRRSVSQGLEPEIDLTGPPTDPGVSRMHAVLIAQPDGGWAILDPGSENGTVVNGTEIAIGERVPLRDGDRVHVGAWTVITIQSSAAGRATTATAPAG
jgi:FHA domain